MEYVKICIRCEGNHVPVEKILCGVDQKIGSNLLKLIKQGGRNKHFIAEFSLLHLRKSKITILLSAYREAGLLDLIKFMKDENESDWSKLLSIQHIDTATKIIKRISTALHVAFLMKFQESLPLYDSVEFANNVLNLKPNKLAEKWGKKLDDFITKSREVNAKFDLHYNMMQHCDEVIAVMISERMGGDDGYALLLNTVRSSLAFSFVNGASSYGPYCVQLLSAHEECGHYYQAMKRTLYSTPVDNSICNFACDTKRELDHQQVIKCFRSGSNIDAITARMSLIDTFTDVHRKFVNPIEKNEDDLCWRITSTDIQHIIPTAQLITNRGLEVTPNDIPYNVYGKKPKALPLEILDINSLSVEQYLLEKYMFENNILNASTAHVPDVNAVNAPKSLLTRLKGVKGVTMKRCTTRSKNLIQTSHEIEEAKRKKTVMKESKQVDRLSSKMNTCQAVVNPDGSKPAVQKASGISKALGNLLSKIVPSEEVSKRDWREFMHIGVENIPENIALAVQFVTIEFVGIKFKAYVQSGDDYLHFVQRKVFSRIVKVFPQVKHVVVCEEKYMFTPDIFKFQARMKRTSKVSGISHLKSGKELISNSKYDQEAILSTLNGKSVVSTYLAKNITDVIMKHPLVIDVDSELYTEGCRCEQKDVSCECVKYTVPIRCIFDGKNKPTVSKLTHIHQMKGEAEMSQVEWMYELLPSLNKGDSIASLVTSGDIDSVPICCIKEMDA